MGALSEEDAGRTVQLGYDDALGAVDNERAAGSHVGDRPEIDILDYRVEIFVFRVCTV